MKNKRKIEILPLISLANNESITLGVKMEKTQERSLVKKPKHTNSQGKKMMPTNKTKFGVSEKICRAVRDTT